MFLIFVKKSFENVGKTIVDIRCFGRLSRLRLFYELGNSRGSRGMGLGALAPPLGNVYNIMYLSIQ